MTRSNNTTAHVIRPVLRAADLEPFVERITSGTKRTKVQLTWLDDSTERQRVTQAVVTTLQPLWSDDATRVWELYPGACCVFINRTGWYRTIPA